jgi:hypothetical protein
MKIEFLNMKELRNGYVNECGHLAPGCLEIFNNRLIHIFKLQGTKSNLVHMYMSYTEDIIV